MKKRFTHRRGGFTLFIKPVLFSLFLLFGFQITSNATHFRYHSTSWSVGTNDTIIFQIVQSWRWSAYGNPALNTNVGTGGWIYGDGGSDNLNMQVTSINSAEDWFTCVTTLKHKYANSGDYTAYYSSCCRISTLLDGNNDLSEIISTLVQVGSNPQNNSPIASVPAIVNFQLNAANTFALPGFDPDGDALTYSVTPTSQSGLAVASPAGLSLSPSGVITWTPTSSGLRAMSITVTDSKGAWVQVDFILRVSNFASNPPTFDYAVTPVNNFVYSVNPGTPINFNVKADDVDAGSQVILTASGVPSGATFTPALPTSPANPATTSFSWTPTTANIGSYIISLTATDNNSQQTISNIIINVNTNPVFNYPPTPPVGTGFCLMTGVPFSQQVEAANLLSAVNVSITSMTGLPATATNTPALPTTPATYAQTTLNWTPSVSEWGPHTVTYTALDDNNKTATTSYNLLVNTSPFFTSGPAPSSVIVGNSYSHLFTGDDPNIPYGDSLEFVSVGLPAWLTLTDNGNGTATLSGTPGAGDVGTYTFDVFLEDIYHHCGPEVKQTITINVSNCVLTLSTSSTDVTCNGLNNGTAGVTINGLSAGNSSFENGLTDWTYIGNASTTGVYGGINPAEGASQGLIQTNGGNQSATDVDAFLNLTPGTVNTAFGTNLTYGSAMKRSITVNSGDVLTLNWDFLTVDYLPFNDVSFLSITGNALTFLADVSTTTTAINVAPNPGSFIHQTGYNTFSYTFATGGTYEIGFGVMNRIDNAVNSGLLVDNVSLNQQIVWSTNPVQTTANVSGLGAGTYTVTVTSGACSATATVTITEPAAITSTVNQSACVSYSWGNMFLTQSGTYTQVFQSAGGCDSTVTLNLTINPLPNVTVTNINSCPGIPAYLNGSPAGGFWSLPNPYNGPSTSFTYFYTDANGCSNSASGTITSSQAIITNITVTNITGISASVNYQVVNGIGWYELRWRPVGSTTWITGTNSNFTTKLLTNLTPGTTYEVQVRGFCSLTSPGGPWNTANFTTNTLCSVPSGLVATNIAANSAKLNWNTVSGVAYYTVRWKPVSGSTWLSSTSTTNSKVVSGLTANTNYEFQVRSHCGNSAGNYSASGTFTTAATKGAAGVVYTEVNGTDLKVYPNPTNGEFNVEFTVDHDGEANIKIFDISGRVVKQVQTAVAEGVSVVTLDISELTTGIYQIQVENEGSMKAVSQILKN